MAGERARGRLPWPVWLAIALAFIVLVGGVGYRFVLPFVLFGPPKVVVRNDSAKTLSDLEVGLSYSGGPSKVKHLDRLKPRGACRMRAEAEVVQVRITFVLDGRTHVHEEQFDLWRGETYSFEIEADGSVRSGYD
jgi:hypothetical protein